MMCRKARASARATRRSESPHFFASCIGFPFNVQSGFTAVALGKMHQQMPRVAIMTVRGSLKQNARRQLRITTTSYYLGGFLITNTA